MVSDRETLIERLRAWAMAMGEGDYIDCANDLAAAAGTIEGQALALTAAAAALGEVSDQLASTIEARESEYQEATALLRAHPGAAAEATRLEAEVVAFLAAHPVPSAVCPVCGGNGLDPVDPFNGDPSGMDAGGGLIYSHDDAPCPNPECVEGRVRES